MRGKNVNFKLQSEIMSKSTLRIALILSFSAPKLFRPRTNNVPVPSNPQSTVEGKSYEVWDGTVLRRSVPFLCVGDN